MKLRKGFTLIELLIVVAIIAILAAIAVPNFLEAQVRSKVSRVKSDLRTMATAIEAYSVDNNRGPLCRNELSVIYPANYLPNYDNLQSQVLFTTPIAYISTIPRDPFAIKGAKNAGKFAHLYYYTYRSYFQGDRWPSTRAVHKIFAKGYTWAFHSFGPSANASKANGAANATLADMLAGGQTMSVYDPSNGTVSYGWLSRTNKGEVTGADFQQ